ncbi:AAA family ATPase [Paraclostridium sordellii]|uniref:AAA family ATPase n=1 Tax=Paraclostridium sordellii TaxID=1505 RepID=UPI0005E80778|nr:ATP-binding protein [Paeniclostridium sordellii]CEQ20889.1 ATPase [[Clostridium] sordellii] [Paeniclostridium sordellii]
MYTEILKIIEGGISKDRSKVISYSKLLSENLKKDGELKFAKKIENLLENNIANPAYLDSFMSSPVDKETRLKIADVIFPNDEVDIVLPKYIENRIDEFILSINKRNILNSLGIDNTTSLLLYGPPGTGKTSIAHMISYKTKLPLIVVRLDTLISSLLGSTSKNIRRIFEYANSRPCILFLDEFDAIAKARDDSKELGELKRVINSLLQNIDEFNKENVLIAATNHHELLDSAIWRRFSTTLEITNPGIEQISYIVENGLQKIDYDFKGNQKKLKLLCEALDGLSAADIKNICSNSIRSAVLNNSERIEFTDIIYETYIYKYHSLKNIEDAVKFLSNYGVNQRSIYKVLNIPARMVTSILKDKEEKSC